LSTPRHTKTKSKDDLMSGMFNKLTIGKSIGKSRRKKSSNFTHKKKYRKTPKPVGMELNGGRRSRRGKH
jgi:hypothetical protein